MEHLKEVDLEIFAVSEPDASGSIPFYALLTSL